MNKVQLIGRVTKDLELRSTQSGTHVVNFTLAVDRKKRDDGADFISCVAYGKVADVLQRYVRKGHRLGLAGHIQTGSYEGRNGKVYTTEVIAEDFDFLEPKSASQDDFTQVESDEDLPF